MPAEELEAYLAACGVSPPGIKAWTQMIAREANRRVPDPPCECFIHDIPCFYGPCALEEPVPEKDQPANHVLLTHPESLIAQMTYDPSAYNVEYSVR
jgi:hypothetical protein